MTLVKTFSLIGFIFFGSTLFCGVATARHMPGLFANRFDILDDNYGDDVPFDNNYFNDQQVNKNKKNIRNW